MTQIFVGHLGNLELSAVAIGLSVISNFSFGFLLGMGSALETLCGQAFGAGQVRMLGIYLQRSWIILIFSCFILCPIYRDDIAELAGRFALWITPQMFANAINFPVQKFLQAQRKVTVLAWIGFIGLVAHVITLWVFLFVLDWRLFGAACKDAWTGLSSAAFTNLWAFIWHLMVLVVLTGGLQNAEIAVDSISICVRVSNELGSGRPRATKHAVMAIIITSLVTGLVCMGGIRGLRDHFAVIFTSDVELQRAVANVAYLLYLLAVTSFIHGPGLFSVVG
ncbi:unnamed protein product [Spirodela intermedia]|uniref:Uncharacterized protein n=1 Tax=Spirodela intermedia TaxID=51605 RepID=A0A7I8J960_SPIIN|nr:unnamed protein product [Spirodela intermedia]CAA6666521.1 unnamed protein product [Spirodela intermedia]